MKVSIIINNYNYGRFLRECLDSALNQNHNDVEVIVVDDVSTDDSRNILEDYGNRIICRNQSINLGHGAAFNKGFAVSTGELIIFLDSDDYLYPYTASSMVKVMRSGVSMVHGQMNLVDEQGRISGRFPSSPARLDRGDLSIAILRQGRINTVVTSGLAFNRSILERIMPVPESEFRQGADGYLVTLAPLLGEVIAIERSVAAYRQHSRNHSQFAKSVAARARWQIEHDSARYAAIREKSKLLGLAPAIDLGEADIDHLSARLASARLETNAHPVTTDRPQMLARKGASVLLLGSGSAFERYGSAIWYIAAGYLPIAVARPLINWWVMPSTRPRLLMSIGRRVKNFFKRNKPLNKSSKTMS